MTRAAPCILFAVLLLAPACAVDPVGPGELGDQGGPVVGGVAQAVSLSQVTSFGSNPGT